MAICQSSKSDGDIQQKRPNLQKFKAIVSILKSWISYEHIVEINHAHTYIYANTDLGSNQDKRKSAKWHTVQKTTTICH